MTAGTKSPINDLSVLPAARKAATMASPIALAPSAIRTVCLKTSWPVSAARCLQSGIADGLGKQHASIRAQLQSLGQRGLVAIVKPGGQP